MNFTLRQWAVIVVLAAGFIGAAILISNTDGPPAAVEEAPDFDEVAWCEAANAISRWSSVLDMSADGDSIDDVRNLRQALADGRLVAPVELSFEIARLQDFALLVDQANDVEADLAAALTAAQGNVDTDRVAQAIAALDDELTACGHAPVSG